MNMMWVIEWWVRKITIEWHYQSLSNCDTDMQEIHLLLMLDIIRDANWVKLGIHDEVYNEVTTGIYTEPGIGTPHDMAIGFKGEDNGKR